MPKKLSLSGLHESLILTWKCNLHCRHCRPYLPEDGSLSLAEMKSYLDTFVKKGSLFLHFTGGEPLMHEDFWKISSYARQKNFALILHTNGTLITPEVGARLKSLNFLYIFMTVLGERKETHDFLTGAKGSFEKTISGLKILKEKDLDVVFTTTRLKENRKEIPQMKRLAEKMEVSFKIIPFQITNKKEIEEFNRCYQKNFQRS